MGVDVPPEKRVEHLVSAGGVVCKGQGESTQVLLCGFKSPLLWALPKGTPNSGETLEQTAIREVQEETGLEVVICQGLGSIEYWFLRTQDDVHSHKTVHFNLMTSVGGSLSLHDTEFDVVQWFPAGEAIRVMTHPSEVGVVRKALACFREELS